MLCADTTVALGRRIFGKPVDAADARGHAGAPVGPHASRDDGGGARVGGGRSRTSALSVSTVRFAAMPESVIAAYVASGEPFGKAGAYAIQSRIAGWIERISGSYSGIMGLPLYETAELLRESGVRFQE